MDASLADYECATEHFGRLLALEDTGGGQVDVHRDYIYALLQVRSCTESERGPPDIQTVVLRQTELLCGCVRVLVT